MSIFRNENAIIGMLGVFLLAIFSFISLKEKEDIFSISRLTVGMSFSAARSSIPPDVSIQWNQRQNQYHVKKGKQQWIFNHEGTLIQIEVSEKGLGVDTKVKVGDPTSALIASMGNPDGSSTQGFKYHNQSYDLFFDLEKDQISHIVMRINNPSSSRTHPQDEIEIQSYYQHSKEETTVYLQHLAKILAQFDIYYIKKHSFPEENTITAFDLYRKMYHEISQLHPPEGLFASHTLLTQSYEKEVEKIELYEQYINHQLDLDTFHNMTDQIQYEINDLRTEAFFILFDIQTYTESKNLYNVLRDQQDQLTEEYKEHIVSEK